MKLLNALALRPRCLGERSFDAPIPANNSPVEFTVGNLNRKLFSPLSYSLSLPFISDRPVEVPVIRLIKARSPLAVFGAVPLIVINPIKGCTRVVFLMLFVRLTHVFKKILKLAPTFTVFYPSTTVVSVIRKVGVIAPTPHIHPTVIQSSSRFSVTTGNSMLCKPMLATAIVGFAYEKITLPHVLISTTFAGKSPNLIAIITQVINRCKQLSFSPVKSFYGFFVYWRWHKGIIS